MQPQAVGSRSFLRSGCGCLLMIVLVLITMIVGVVVMSSGPAPLPKSGPTPVSTTRASGAAVPAALTSGPILLISPRRAAPV